MSAWCLGILNSHRKFFLSYVAPVIWNLALIAALVWRGGHVSSARLAEVLAWASVVGSALQFGVQLPVVLRFLWPVRARLRAAIPRPMSSTLRSCLLALALVASLVGLSSGTAGARQSARPLRDREEPRAAQAAQATPSIKRLSRAERATRAAVREVGVPYRWGGESPATGFDCSGLVRWAYGRVGVELPHSSYALNGVGRPVRSARLAVGDILVFAGLGHVGLYVGRGRMVHAPETGRNVEIVTLGATGYGARLVGAHRVAPRVSRRLASSPAAARSCGTRSTCSR
jgi:cell wall-associated NlpC family hydrolase